MNDACAHALEVQYRASTLICNHADGGLCDAVDAMGNTQGLDKVVHALRQDDALARTDILDRRAQVKRLVDGAQSAGSAVRGNVDLRQLCIGGGIHNGMLRRDLLGVGQRPAFAQILRAIRGKDHLDDHLALGGQREDIIVADFRHGRDRFAHLLLIALGLADVHIRRASHIAHPGQGVLLAVAGAAGDDGHGRDDLLHGTLLSGSVICRVNDRQLHGGERRPCTARRKKAYIHIFRVQKSQRSGIIVLVLADDLAVLAIIGDEVAGVVALDLQVKIRQLANGDGGLVQHLRVGVVADDVVIGHVLVGLHGGGGFQRIGHAKDGILGVRRAAQLGQHAKAQAHGELLACIRYLAVLEVVLDLAGQRHVLVVEEGIRAVGRDGVRRHEAKALLAVGVIPVIHMHAGTQGEILVRRDGSVVERHAIVRVGLNLALAILGIHGHKAVIVDGTDIAIVLFIGGRAIHHKGPGTLGLLGGGGGHLCGEAAGFLVPQRTYGERIRFAHSQAGGSVFRTRSRTCDFAVHKHLVASGFWNCRPHQVNIAFTHAGSAGEGRRTQGQHEALRPAGIKLGLLTFAVQLRGEGVLTRCGRGEFQAMLVLLSDGAAGLDHIALAVHHADEGLIAAVIADICIQGGHHFAIAHVLGVDKHHGHLHRSPSQTARLDGLQLPRGDLDLKQIVAAVRHAQVVIPRALQLEIRDIQRVFEGVHLGFRDDLARPVVQRKLPGIAAGHPPQTHRRRAVHGEFHAVDHALARLGLAAEIQALGGGIPIIKGFAAAVNLRLGGVQNGEVVFHHIAVTIRLFALGHGGQVSGGVKDVFAVLRAGHNKKQAQHKQQYGTEFLHERMPPVYPNVTSIPSTAILSQCSILRKLRSTTRFFPTER